MVGSKVVHEIYTWYGDRWLLDLLYPGMADVIVDALYAISVYWYLYMC